MSFDLLRQHVRAICGQKICGLTIAAHVSTSESQPCLCYEAEEDSGVKRLVFFYKDADSRDIGKGLREGFHTSFDIPLKINAVEVTLYGNVFDHRVVMTDEVRNYLTQSTTKPKVIEGFDVLEVLGSGFKGVTFRVKTHGGPGTSYALKLTIAEEYGNGSPLPEVQRMVELSENDSIHFPKVHAHGDWSDDIAGRKHGFHFIVQDFVKGTSLKRYLDINRGCVNAAFLQRFLVEMLAALTQFERCDLMHDDLHGENIMVRELPGEHQFCVIDFGSTKRRGRSRKDRDDLRNLAAHLASIHNIIDEREEPRAKHEDAILQAVQAVHASISDEDPLRRPESPSKLITDFGRYFEPGQFEQHLLSPFDFGNAEEVLDDRLLQSLAASSFPWIDDITGTGNLLLIGPRGCGKTTVFRSMSFNCMAEAGRIDEALERNYVGLYISCNREFRHRFSAIEREAIIRQEDAIRHYFNLVVAREITHALSLCLSTRAASGSDVSALIVFLQEQFNLDTSNVAPAEAALADIRAIIVRKIYATRMDIWNGVTSTAVSRQDFVAELAELIRNRITSFQGKTLYLFVDDYTAGKVPVEMQKALNHVLFVPNSSYRCKISAEVFGVVPDQTFGTFLDKDRDYKELNLGTLYHALRTEEQKDFLREIVDKRLEICQYKGAVDSLIGESAYQSGTLERSLKGEAEARRTASQKRSGNVPSGELDREVESVLREGSQKVYYHGWDTVCRLCTGDISNILELLNTMFKECAIGKSTVERIEPRYQNDVIERFSKNYLMKIKGIPKYGEKLFQIADAFGNMSAQLLRDHSWVDRVSSGKSRKEPYRVIRIEMDEGYVRKNDTIQTEVTQSESIAADHESDESLELWHLLQRYCVFIDAEQGRSRRNTIATKVILRRIFCPAFRTGLVNSECFLIEKPRWRAFCADPKGSAEKYVRDVLKEVGDDQIMFPSFEND